jgi:hypothetical protein
MESLLIDKIVDVTNLLNHDDQEKVLAHAKKILAARRIDTAYSGDFIPFEISEEEIEKEIKMKRLQSKI